MGSMETSAPDQADQKILSAAAPKIFEAARDAGSIIVKGEQLVATSGCNGRSLKFQLQQAAPAKKGDWSVHVLQGSVDVSSDKLK